MKKRLLSIILTLALCLSLLPTAALAVEAQEGISVQAQSGDVTIRPDTVDANGNITSGTFNASGPVLKATDTTLSGKYYIVQESVTINGNLTIDGSKIGGLVLCDGVTLTVKGALIHNGGTSFFIYGQTLKQNSHGTGRLVIENSKDTGAAIRSTANDSQLGISSGELELHGGAAGQLIDKVYLYSTQSIHTAAINGKTMPLTDWKDKTSIKGTKLVIEYCEHLTNDLSYVDNRDNATHHLKCDRCGFEWSQQGADNEYSKISHDDFTYEKINDQYHKATCVCGYVIEEQAHQTVTDSAGNPVYMPTSDGKGHVRGACECGYTSGNVETHTYDKDGACSACDFNPIISDSKGNLYDNYADAFEAAAKDEVEWVQLESFVKDESDNYTNIVSRGFDFDYSGQSVRLKTNGKTLNTSDGTLLDVSAGTLIVEGEAKILETGTYNGSGSAINITGGSLIFENALTAQGGVDSKGQHPAISATGGTLDMQGAVTLTGGLKVSGSAVLATKLKEGDVLNGGVSVGGSYNSVNELLGTGLAFAEKNAPNIIVNGGLMSINKDVTVVKHTKHEYVHGACDCGAVCPHNTIDNANGKCADCGETFPAAVNGTLNSDMTQAIVKWLTEGGTLKLYTDGGTVAFTNVTGKELTIDLNGHSINKNQSAINLSGVKLTIQDSREATSSNGAFGPIVADSGSLTLENGGYLQGLEVPSNSTAKIELKDGQVSGLVCSKPVYNLLPDGYALMNGNNTVDPTKSLSSTTATYIITNAQLQNKNTTTTGNTTFGSGTIPFTLSLSSSYTMWNEPIGRMKFRWYYIDKNGAAKQLIESANVTPVDILYSYDVTTNMNGEQGYKPEDKEELEKTLKENWASMTPGEYKVICVVIGKASDGAYRWQTALTGYTLTVTQADLNSEKTKVMVTNADSLVYTGQALTPEVTVTYDGATLTKDKDYTVSYANNINAGTATVTITGMGNYEGSKTVTWTIKPAELTFTVNAVSKAYDGTDTADVDVIFTGLLNGEELIKGTDYTVAATYDSVAAGEGKTVTGTVTLENGNYTLSDNKISTTGTITKGKAPQKTTVLYIANNLARTYTIDLTLPKLDNEKMQYGNYSFALGEIQVDSGYYQVGTAAIADGKLNIPIKAVDSETEKQVGTIKVTLISDNIADCTWTIELYAVNRIIPTGTPTPSKTTLVYGEKLDTITLSGTMYDRDAEVAGKFQWDSSNTISTIGKQNMTWRFVPTDYTKYIDATGTVEIEVLKATPTGEPKYTAITTSGKKLSDAGLAKNENWPDGTVKWVGADGAELSGDTEVKANTAYKWVFTPTSGNYNSIEGSITLYPVSSSGGSSKPSYSVNTPGKTENGSVSLSTKNAVKGSTVTVTVQPESGYVLDKLTVTDQDGKQLAVTDLGNGKYTFVMPAGTVKVEASFQEQAKTPAFEDVSEDAYYYEAVQWAQEKGITDGISEDLFGPNQPCTRGQIVTFLWRAAGSPEPKGTSSFADVPAESYYAKAVAWAVENGVTNGTGAGTFSPDAPCDRAQSVTFLFRALGGETEGGANFSDVPAGSYYADAVAWAAENGITNGTSSTTFSPNDTCTRGQIVTFLYRGYQGK